MNFDEAITTHSMWKNKLKAYLTHPDGSLKPADVQADNKCALGQWIYTEGKRWSANPQYATLVSEHAKFHAAAAAVLRKADSGEAIPEELATGTKSDFGRASVAVVNAISRLRREVQ
jgi:Chemoreceptor zinc-binding domain